MVAATLDERAERSGSSTHRERGRIAVLLHDLRGGGAERVMLALVRGFVDAWEETVIAAVLIGSGVWVAMTRGTWEPAAMLWAVLLFVQSLPFVSALIMSMIAVLPFKKITAPLPGIALGTELGRAK